MPQPSITKICLKITYLKFQSNFPGANELSNPLSLDAYLTTIWLPHFMLMAYIIIIVCKKLYDEHRVTVPHHHASEPLSFNLTHCGLRGFNEILDEYFSKQLQWLMAEIPTVKLPSEESN